MPNLPTHSLQGELSSGLRKPIPEIDASSFGLDFPLIVPEAPCFLSLATVIEQEDDEDFLGVGVVLLASSLRLESVVDSVVEDWKGMASATELSNSDDSLINFKLALGPEPHLTGVRSWNRGKKERNRKSMIIMIVDFIIITR